MLKNRWISFITTIVLLVSMLSIFAIGVAANEAYPNTHINTGDHRRDIIGVALTQLGYKEGPGNDTKYGDWYNLPYNPWCAMFVSWCADQAEIPTTILNKSALASPAVSCFNIACYDSSQYTPVSGDLFFTKSYSHVGLVYYVEGDYFYSLEGNSNDNGSNEGERVVSIKRKLSDYKYGVPKYVEGYALTVQYNAGGGVIKGSEKTKDQYKVLIADGINLRSGAGTNYRIVTALPKNSTFIVTETKNANGYTWGKTTFEGKTGWCVINNHWSEKIAKVPATPYYLDSNGLILEASTAKEKTIVLRTGESSDRLFPKASDLGLTRDGRTFAGWVTAPFEGDYYPVGTTLTAEELNGGELQQGKTVVLQAVWMPKSIEIEYHANGGNIISDAYRIKANLLYKSAEASPYRQKWNADAAKTSTLVNDETFGIYKRGYRFMGWSFTKNGKKVYDEDLALNGEKLYAEGCNGNVAATLYAVWAPNTLRVQYHANGGTLDSKTYVSKSDGIYTIKNDKIYQQEWIYNQSKKDGLVNDSTFGLKREGYQFLGWSTSKNGGTILNMDDKELLPMEINAKIIDADQAVTLYARWIENSHSHEFKDYHYNHDSTAEKEGTETAACSCGATHTRQKNNTKLQDSAKVFKDVIANAWYKHYIDYAYTHKIMVGTGNDTMQPQKEMTRAEFVQLMASLSGIDTTDRNVQTPFKDVKAGAWYAPAVKWAVEHEIVSGFGDDTFGPNLSITREQMCSILVRYAKAYLKMELPTPKQPDLFTDHDQISSWASADIYTCKEAQIISGVSENEFDPKGIATRAAVATMISRFHENYVN